MENVILVVHLVLALCLIGVVLLQRNEGGGGLLGGGGAITGRSGVTPLGKLTWAFGIAFVITSLALTILAAQNAVGTSVLDRLRDGPVSEAPAELPADDLLPPALGDGPLLPPSPSE